MLGLFTPEIPIPEKIFRSAIVYIFILLLLRFSGKRQIGELSPFDFVVLLIIADITQNAASGPDNSIGGGLLGALVIFGLNHLLDELAYRSKTLRRYMEPMPCPLIHHGKIIKKNMRNEKITHDELMAGLRKEGIMEVQKVRYAFLEDDGSISVIPFKES